MWHGSGTARGLHSGDHASPWPNRMHIMHSVGANRPLNHHVKTANTGSGGMRERGTLKQRDAGGLIGSNRTNRHVHIARLGDAACPWPGSMRTLRLEGSFRPQISMLKAACTRSGAAREREALSYRGAGGLIGKRRTNRHVRVARSRDVGSPRPIMPHILHCEGRRMH